jgi:LemA protein
MITVIIGATVLIAGTVAAVNYNSLVKGRNKCEEAFSTIDVYLKKRFDLIPNLVSTVKGYASHEAKTLEKVVAARNLGITGQMENEKKISSALKSIFALSENYPNLKADTNFMELQKQLKSIEEDIAQARKYYNGCVREYNNRVTMFPSNIVAGIFRFKKMPMLQMENSEERKNVTVTF